MAPIKVLEFFGVGRLHVQTQLGQKSRQGSCHTPRISMQQLQITYLNALPSLGLLVVFWVNTRVPERISAVVALKVNTQASGVLQTRKKKRSVSDSNHSKV